MTTVSHAPGRHYEVGGHRLWVETEGDGPPLLLLAGLGPAGSHVIFHPFFAGMDAAGRRSTDPEMAAEFATAARLVRFYNPDHAALLSTEPGARNLELYPMFVGADVDFIIGGEVARIPDFRPRLKEITVPVMVLAGRYDRALYPSLQRQFTESDPRIRLEFLERSGSFSHVEEPEAVFALIREFSADGVSAER